MLVHGAVVWMYMYLLCGVWCVAWRVATRRARIPIFHIHVHVSRMSLASHM